MIKVCKFGGTSVASAESLKKVADIIKSDASRRFIVVSAPGKRHKDDKKITDLLYDCFDRLKNAGDVAPSEIAVAVAAAFAPVEKRFLDMVRDLGLDLDIKSVLDKTKNEIILNDSKDFTASRGEYLGAIVLSSLLGFDFVDAAQIIKFDTSGQFNAELSNDFASQELSKHKYAVIPGFYGRTPSGEIKTFSRGGSDISGAIAARAVGAKIYENFTDVDGFYVTDPRVVKNPKRIERLSYRELRELSYMGADVLHADAVFPVSKCGIPINIKNTFNPSHAGTLIVDDGKFSREAGRTVTGVAGRKDFTIINLEKDMMNTEVGFARKILSILEELSVSFEHMPTGIDTMGLIIAAKSLSKGVLDTLINRISEEVFPDLIEIIEDISLIAIVGRNMANTKGTAARLFSALAENDITVRLIDQGSSELNIIVGVENKDYEKAINAIYREFIL
jgi:aspartate kinase